MEPFRNNNLGHIRKLLYRHDVTNETLTLVGGFIDYLGFLGSQPSYSSVADVASNFIDAPSLTLDKISIANHVCNWLLSTDDMDMYSGDADQRLVNRVNQTWQVLLALHLAIIPDAPYDRAIAYRSRSHIEFESARTLIAGLRAIGSLTERYVGEKAGLVSRLRADNQVLKEKVEHLEQQVQYLERNLLQQRESRDLLKEQTSAIAKLEAHLESRVVHLMESVRSMETHHFAASPDFRSMFLDVTDRMTGKIEDSLKPVSNTENEIRNVLGQISKVVAELHTTPKLAGKLRQVDDVDNEVSPAWHLPGVSSNTWNAVSKPHDETFLPIVILDLRTTIDFLRLRAWNELRGAVEQATAGVTGQKRIPVIVLHNSDALIDTESDAFQVADVFDDNSNPSDEVLKKLQRIIRGTPVAVYTDNDVSILPLGSIQARECRSLFKLQSEKSEVALSNIIEDLSLDYRLQSPNVYRRLRNLVDAGLVDKNDDSHYLVTVPSIGYPNDRYISSLTKHQGQSDNIVDISVENSSESEWFITVITRVVSIIYQGEFVNDRREVVSVSPKDRLSLSVPTLGLRHAYRHLLAGLLFEHHRIEFTFVD